MGKCKSCRFQVFSRIFCSSNDEKRLFVRNYSHSKRENAQNNVMVDFLLRIHHASLTFISTDDQNRCIVWAWYNIYQGKREENLINGHKHIFIKQTFSTWKSFRQFCHIFPFNSFHPFWIVILDINLAYEHSICCLYFRLLQ